MPPEEPVEEPVMAPTAAPAVTPLVAAAPSPAPPSGGSLGEPVALDERLLSQDEAGDSLRDSLAAMEGLTSYRYLMRVVTGVEAGQEQAGLLGSLNAEISAEGAVSLPGRERIKLTMDLAGFILFTVEMVQVDGMTYVRNPLTGEWEPDDGSFEAPGAPTALFDQDFLVPLEYAGLEELPAGLRAHHLLSRPDPAVLKGHMLDPGEGVESLEAHYWVGQDDFLVHRIRIVLSQQLPEGLVDIDTRVRFLDHNEPIVIELPELPDSDPSGSPSPEPPGVEQSPPRLPG